MGLRGGEAREGPLEGLSSQMSGRQEGYPLAELTAQRGMEVSNRNPKSPTVSAGGWMRSHGGGVPDASIFRRWSSRSLRLAGRLLRDKTYSTFLLLSPNPKSLPLLLTLSPSPLL